MRKGRAPTRFGPTVGLSFLWASVASVLVLLSVPLARAQTPPPVSLTPPTSQVPGVLPPAANDPRKGPRLIYQRGPAECLDEVAFRDEVAIVTDGLDHLAADSAASVRVWFEKSGKTYRGFAEYTSADGVKDAPIVKTDPYCPMLGRWVAGTVSDYVPPAPRPSAPKPPSSKPPEPAEGPAVNPGDALPAQPFFVPPKLVRQSFPPLPVVRSPAGSLSLSEIWKRMDLTIGLSAYALMTAGFTANVGPGFGIGIDARGEYLSLGVEIRGVLPGVVYARTVIDPTKPSTPQSFDLSHVTGLLVPCVRPVKYLVLCGVAEAGVQIHAGYSGSLGPELTFGPRVGLDLPLGDHFALFAFAEMLFPAIRNHGTFDIPSAAQPVPGNVAWDQSLVSGFFAAGVSYRFK